MSLEIQNLSYSYDDHQVLKELSLRLESGEIGALIGVSGSGKSTLLKIIAGLLPLQKGTLFKSDECAYMTQENLLLPWRTVMGNLLLLAELGLGKVIPPSEIEELLRDMGLSGCEPLYPAQLSVGMRQRVALAQTLLMKRPLLLLDEPFNSLDFVLRERMYELLKEINRKRRTTMLMVTHDFHDAMTLADRIFLLSEGKIAKEWTVPKKEPLAALKEEILSAVASQAF